MADVFAECVAFERANHGSEVYKITNLTDEETTLRRVRSWLNSPAGLRPSRGEFDDLRYQWPRHQRKSFRWNKGVYIGLLVVLTSNWDQIIGETHCFPRAVAYLDSGKIRVKGKVSSTASTCIFMWYWYRLRMSFLSGNLTKHLRRWKVRPHAKSPCNLEKDIHSAESAFRVYLKLTKSSLQRCQSQLNSKIKLLSYRMWRIFRYHWHFIPYQRANINVLPPRS